MPRGGPRSTSLAARVFAAVATVTPIVAAIALVLLLSDRDADVNVVNSAAATAPTATVPGPATAGTSTAGPADRRAPAFADPATEFEADGATEEAVADGARPREAPNGGSAGRNGPSAGRPPTTPVKGGQIVWVRNREEVRVLDAPGGSVVAKQGDVTEFGSPSVFSVQKRSRGWLGISTPLVANDDMGWIRADPRDLRLGYVDYSVVVDLSERSAALYEGEALRRSWPVTVGAASTPTPTGTFAVTDTFRGGLNPAYGCCAVALSATQPNLPQGWAGGNRIAFHGTGGPLGVAASSGCIRSDDGDVQALLRTVPLGTPVKIHE